MKRTTKATTSKFKEYTVTINPVAKVTRPDSETLWNWVNTDTPPYGYFDRVDKKR